MTNKKNQLFRKNPTDELIQKIVIAFGFRSLNDRRCFSRNDLIKLDTVNIIKDLKPELELYYLPCKARTFLNDLNCKNVVTILRQCIKTKGFIIFSREKYCKGDKFIVYNLQPIDKKSYISVTNNNLECNKDPVVLNFN